MFSRHRGDHRGGSARTAWSYAVQHKELVRLIVEGDQDSRVRKATRPRIMGMFTAVFSQGVQEGLFRQA